MEAPTTKNALLPSLVLFLGMMQFVPSEEQSRRCDGPMLTYRTSCSDIVLLKNFIHRIYGSIKTLKTKN